jgi:hypothetical protein
MSARNIIPAVQRERRQAQYDKLTFQDVLRATKVSPKHNRRKREIERVRNKLEQVYEGETYSRFIEDVGVISPKGPTENKAAITRKREEILQRWGIVDQDHATKPLINSDAEEPAVKASTMSTKTMVESSETLDQKQCLPTKAHAVKSSSTVDADVQAISQPVEVPVETPDALAPPPAQEGSPGKAGKRMISNLHVYPIKVAKSRNFELQPIKMATPKVPQLSHDLSRVLFNPGVYQLQDPRSRVWNFDPYLGKIMPVSEFNFGALNKYMTSSEDAHLRQIAIKQKKRYIGSTSSLSSTLSHFHFLLSGFRDLTMDNMSKGFGEEHKTFTRLQKGPTAIFLRYQDGVYAVDADKEFDSANILMSLGRSMEKLLTLPKAAFEQYRKSHDPSIDSKMQSITPEAYHYSGIGQFLVRSQLDAYDPRVPGTGMFDLKTRAVAGVRMMLSNHEEGIGYQIKGRYGTWESFEREYYDMMRAAFLKYSLQVRMGRMDGIFVAYHNVQRIFGFQYIPLAEMDLALHGQTNRKLGDHEFFLSFGLLNDIFNQATKKYPKQSIRFHFETREATEANPPFMYIFAEPVTDDEIRNIQTAKREEIEAYEQRLFNPGGSSATQQGPPGSPASSTPNKSTAAPMREPTPADVAFLENLMGVDLKASAGNERTATKVPQETSAPKATDVNDLPEGKEFTAWKLNIRSIVNGQPVLRPTTFHDKDTWDVEYSLEPLGATAGRRNYTLCKNRRRATLQFAQEEDAPAGYYIQQLVNMSRQGAEWRRQLDALDARRDEVVLYGDPKHRNPRR